MATKPLVTTTVYYHGGTDPIVFADAINNGETTRDGSNVRAQLLREDTVEGIGAIDGGTAAKYIVPYHSVIFAVIEVSTGEFTPAEDAFCVAGDN